MSVTSNEVRKNLKQQQDEEEQSNYSFRLGYLQLQYLQIKCFIFKWFAHQWRGRRGKAILEPVVCILCQKRILNQLFFEKKVFKQETSESFD